LLGVASNPLPVTLTNSGGATLDFTRAIISTSFSQTNTCPPKLAPGAQCTGNIIFTPHNINTINGAITLYDNTFTSPQILPLTGVGTVVTLLPSSLDFGSQPVGTSSQPQMLTFTNHGPLPVTIYSGQFTGRNPGAFAVTNGTCGMTVLPGQSCTANIVFAPHITGPNTATLDVNDNGGGSPQTVTLSGNGT